MTATLPAIGRLPIPVRTTTSLSELLHRSGVIVTKEQEEMLKHTNDMSSFSKVFFDTPQTENARAELEEVTSNENLCPPTPWELIALAPQIKDVVKSFPMMTNHPVIMDKVFVVLGLKYDARIEQICLFTTKLTDLKMGATFIYVG